MKVWFDTEFIDTGSVIYLLSIGLIREDGAHYYAEVKGAPKELACEWVKKNVLTKMSGAAAEKPRYLIKADLEEFCGFRPEFWTYFGAYDWVLLCQLFGRMLDVPAHWPNHPMDVQQERVRLGVAKLPEQSGQEHNALDDAIWTRQAWAYLQELQFGDKSGQPMKGQ